MLKRWLACCLLTALLPVFSSPTLAAGSAVVLVPTDVMNAFRELVDPEQVSEIEDFAFLQGKPAVAELVLLIQALQVGGFDDSISVKAAASQAEVLEQLASGEVALSGTSFWRSQVQPLSGDFWLSDALVRQGEFGLGVYTCGKPLRAQQLISGLPNYTGVFGDDESVSLKTLQSVGVKRLLIMDDRESVVEVLCNGNADFTFAPFPADASLVLHVGEHRLQPVQGIKVGVEGSRHFVVSKANGRGKSLYFMLQRGLRKMRVRGKISQMYEQTGFVNSRVEHWQLLNP